MLVTFTIHRTTATAPGYDRGTQETGTYRNEANARRRMQRLATDEGLTLVLVRHALVVRAGVASDCIDTVIARTHGPCDYCGRERRLTHGACAPCHTIRNTGRYL